MDYFHYRKGELHCEGVPIARIADEYGTPCYVYSTATLREHYDRFAAAFAPLKPILCFSIKSCPNLHICRLLHERGSGFDVVSGGELARALAAGADPARIVFAGVGKTDREILEALDAKIGWFNIESESEMANLVDLCRRRGRTARAALRINPDVDPHTHRYTTTGTKETKFGVDLGVAREVFAKYARQEVVRLCGLHLHIGSPVNTVEPYVSAIRKTLDLMDALRADGHDIDTLDIGGGFGAHYTSGEAPPAATYAEAIVPLLVERVAGSRPLRIILEPGRSIAANAGILVARTLHLKATGERNFLIVDAGMNDLIRPTLYEAYHFIWPVRPGAEFEPTARGRDVACPGQVRMDVGESGDFFAKDRLLPPMKRGDLIAVFTTGAYGMAMASHYNSRPKAAEVLVDGEAYRLIRRRETYDDLMAAEISLDRS
jgi:diaminopimelate decarboxylase